jgi:3-demethoxyubiquinol 3-hydroxylase
MNFIDQLIGAIDDGLRVVSAKLHAGRAVPRTESTSTTELSDTDRAHSIGLMRVNHCGEVCAQALYSGQLLFARETQTREVLEHARQEETDHLAWCEGRIDALGGRTSVLNPLFYAGSFALGATSALVGDKVSLGFLTETEKQVEAHLADHLERLPKSDAQSRRIVEAMREDEIRHGQSGTAHGGVALPAPVKWLMKSVSKVMTTTTYRI